MAGLSDDDIRELERLQAVLAEGDYFAALGVKSGVDRKELRAAYYRLSRRFHPDRFYRQDLQGREELLDEVFGLINLAYRTLDDPEARGRHERERLRAPRPAKTPAAAAEAAAPTSNSTPSGTTSRRSRVEREHASGIKRPRPARRPRPEPKAQPAVGAPQAVDRFKKRMMQRLRKARRHYVEGQAEMEAENWARASSAFYLACQFDPRNRDYRKALDEANRKARVLLAQQLVAQGQNSEDYGSAREAIQFYEQAVDLKPPTGDAYYNLGRLLRRMDDKDRSALEHLRNAVRFSPKKIKYRLALAACYTDFGMNLNAQREYRKVLEVDPSNETAKTGLKATR